MQMTKVKPDGSWSVIGTDGKIVPWKEIPKELAGVVYKLHAYERTGLNPNAVEVLIEKSNHLCKLVDELQKTIEGRANE